MVPGKFFPSHTSSLKAAAQGRQTSKGICDMRCASKPLNDQTLPSVWPSRLRGLRPGREGQNPGVTNVRGQPCLPREGLAWQALSRTVGGGAGAAAAPGLSPAGRGHSAGREAQPPKWVHGCLPQLASCDNSYSFWAAGFCVPHTAPQQPLRPTPTLMGSEDDGLLRSDKGAHLRVPSLLPLNFTS